MTSPNQSPEPLSIKPQPQIDQYQLDMLIQQKRDNQNLGLAAVGGLLGAAVGAGVWAAVTALTHFQIGWMAVGVGFLVGYLARRFGQGVDPSFGVIGAVLSLVGCLAGNLFASCIMVARAEGMQFIEVLSALTPEIVVEIFKVTFSPIDLLFYGIAVYEGYRFSILRLTEAELSKLIK